MYNCINNRNFKICNNRLFRIFRKAFNKRKKTSDIVFTFTVTIDKKWINVYWRIKRKDFNVGGNGPISNEPIVKLNVLAKKN